MISGWIDSKLKGWPDHWLSYGLLAIAAFAVLVAIYGKPHLKLPVLTWLLAP